MSRPDQQWLEAHAAITLPTAAAFFYGSRMGGIYEVPPKHRTRPARRFKQFGSQDKAPGKPERAASGLSDAPPGPLAQVPFSGSEIAPDGLPPPIWDSRYAPPFLNHQGP